MFPDMIHALDWQKTDHKLNLPQNPSRTLHLFVEQPLVIFFQTETRVGLSVKIPFFPNPFRFFLLRCNEMNMENGLFLFTQSPKNLLRRLVLPPFKSLLKTLSWKSLFILKWCYHLNNLELLSSSFYRNVSAPVKKIHTWNIIMFFYLNMQIINNTAN